MDIKCYFWDHLTAKVIFYTCDPLYWHSSNVAMKSRFWRANQWTNWNWKITLKFWSIRRSTSIRCVSFKVLFTFRTVHFGYVFMLFNCYVQFHRSCYWKWVPIQNLRQLCSSMNLFMPWIPTHLKIQTCKSLFIAPIYTLTWWSMKNFSRTAFWCLAINSKLQ